MTDGASTLRRLFASAGVIRLIGAHNALGARMAARSGFDGVWSSSFELSASHAVPDAGIITLSEHLEVVRAMCRSVEVPVVADCDTGYGDSLHFADAVRQFEAAGVAAVCIEDKLFPKVNSFARGRQALAPIEEFVSKLRAGKQAQRGPDFCIIARVEALIAGEGRVEALRRAHAYADAGADAILVHSKSPTVDELADVVLSWNRPVPLVAVPTSYYRTTAEQLAAMGIKMVIYANQGLRCALKAMEQAYAEILRSGSTALIEERLWSMDSIFELQSDLWVERMESDIVVQGAGSES